MASGKGAKKRPRCAWGPPERRWHAETRPVTADSRAAELRSTTLPQSPRGFPSTGPRPLAAPPSPALPSAPTRPEARPSPKASPSSPRSPHLPATPPPSRLLPAAPPSTPPPLLPCKPLGRERRGRPPVPTTPKPLPSLPPGAWNGKDRCTQWTLEPLPAPPPQSDGRSPPPSLLPPSFPSSLCKAGPTRCAFGQPVPLERRLLRGKAGQGGLLSYASSSCLL